MTEVGCVKINNNSGGLSALVGKYKLFNAAKQHFCNVKIKSNTYEVFNVSDNSLYMRIVKDTASKILSVYTSVNNFSEPVILLGRNSPQLQYSPLGRLCPVGRITLCDLPFGNYVGSCEEGTIQQVGAMAKKEIFIGGQLIGMLEKRTVGIDEMIRRDSKVHLYSSSTLHIACCLAMLVISQGDR